MLADYVRRCAYKCLSFFMGDADYNNTKDISPLRGLDIFLLFSLFSFFVLYQLQLVASWMPRLFKLRELIYFYLYIRVLLFYRVRFTYGLLFLCIFIAYSVFLGIHTYMYYGMDLAVQGFMRFLSVALLAPLAAVIFSNEKQLRPFIGMWLAVLAMGAATALYQLVGGDMAWLVQDYQASRAGLPRFKTLLGEPNIGGMASAMGFVYGIMYVKKRYIKIIILLSSVCLLVLSMSKAALGGFFLGSVFLIVIYRKSIAMWFKKNRIKKLAVAAAICILLFGTVFVSSITGFGSGFVKYATTMLSSIISQAGSKNAAFDFFTDLGYRVLGKAIQGLEIVRDRHDIFALNILSGSSFGVAGSVALEMQGSQKAIMPHNGYLEVFLVGGLIMLFIFLAIILLTLYKLLYMAGVNGSFKSMFVVFILLMAFLVSYPVIYEPITGSMFWLVVGTMANGQLISGSRKFQGSRSSI